MIVFMPCGLGLERCRAEALRIAERSEWRVLRASKTGCVFVTNGNSYFNRPVPRLAAVRVGAIDALTRISAASATFTPLLPVIYQNGKVRRS